MIAFFFFYGCIFNIFSGSTGSLETGRGRSFVKNMMDFRQDETLLHLCRVYPGIPAPLI